VIALSIAFYCVGSAGNFLAASYLDLKIADLRWVAANELTGWDIIAGGAQDLAEEYIFLDRFTAAPDPPYNFGFIWLGGLIPLQSRYSASIWSIEVEQEMTYEEASNAVSGGLRLHVPIEGYTFCDWPGVIVFSLLIGILTGYIVRAAARHVHSANPPEINAVFVLATVELVGNLPAASWHSLLPLLSYLPLLFPVRLGILPRHIDWISRPHLLPSRT
jgi:hypothetical protein